MKTTPFLKLTPVKIVTVFVIFLILSFGLSIYFRITKAGKNKPEKANCDIVMTSNDRVYLNAGSIFTFDTDKKGQYYIIDKSTDIPRDSFNHIICFSSERDAEATGFKKVIIK